MIKKFLFRSLIIFAVVRAQAMPAQATMQTLKWTPPEGYSYSGGLYVSAAETEARVEHPLLPLPAIVEAPQGAGANSSNSVLCPSGYTHVQGATALSGTTTSAIIAAVSGQFVYVKSIQTVNIGATNALISVYTNGTAAPIAYTVAPTNTTPFGGSNVSYDGTLQTTTSNKSLDIGAGASSTTIYVSVQGCQGP